jgi:3-phosphoshikimate 1-carboxyvinyltransferase
LTFAKNNAPKPMTAIASHTLTGEVRAPGDKSISHRALIFGSMRLGALKIHNLLGSDDVKATAEALRQLGVPIEVSGDITTVSGVGIGGLSEPTGVLDMGNSGTAARLLMGLVAPYAFSSFFTGDESLCKRPMKRVLDPLALCGMQHQAASGDRLPLVVRGVSPALPINYTSPVASAQVKSAVLLAGFNLAGTTTLTEPTSTRDHTERMAKHFGFALDVNGNAICVTGMQQPPRANAELTVAGDPSSAAFPAVAALICEGSTLLIKDICYNKERIGIYTWLAKMGAKIAWENEREAYGEQVADLRVAYSALKGIEIPAQAAPAMIDEYPILAVAAANASGTTIMHGLDELRVKESDRLQAIYDGLIANGVRAEIDGDAMIVHGGDVKGGGRVKTHFDHRIAMSFLVMGLAAKQPVIVDDGRAIATSFPNFEPLMRGLGANISPERRRGKRTAPERRLVMAIDGPAASGKGTLAHKLSRHLNLPYLDTGTLYRAVGLRLIAEGKDPSCQSDAIAQAKAITVQDLSDPALRQEKVGQAASVISAMPEVRQILLDYQRTFAATKTGAIFDGRDIGTVVCPDADIKIFMTASVEARAKRRHKQLQGEGFEVVYESVLEGLRERDSRDENRENAPLTAAPDAIQIDTTDMRIDEVFDVILKTLEARNRYA